MVIRFLAALCCACVLFAMPAEARQRHHAAPQFASECFTIMPCEGAVRPSGGFLDGVISIRVTMKRDRVRRSVARVSATAGARAAYGVPSTPWGETTLVDRVRSYITPQVVAHPAGCPSRAFCGCGASVRVFGRSVRELWLAANWFKFPKTVPASGMVAVRKHHVFVLEAHLGGNTWQVFDANSGGRRTRIHARSIAGYAIVNPHAAP
jgi:hypothetical protein